jgi:cobalt-zinc-cadmium efflux system outer membrane protein
MVTTRKVPDPIVRKEPLGIAMVNGKSGTQLARLNLFVTLFLAASSLTALAQNPPPPPAPSNQTGYTWDQVKSKFEAANPTLKADAINVDEMKAQEITAYLRPNPQFTLSTDGTQIAPYHGVWKPTTGTEVTPNFSYLHERDRKRELRLESAKEGTQISTSQHQDLERNLLFNLRSVFIQTMQAKAVLTLTREELDYYDHLINISQERFKAGDLAQIDLDRIELQRVQYESDLQAAEVNLRTSKIQLLQLLNDRTPVDQFDVQGLFDFSDKLQPLDAFRQIALDNRPDLKAALESVQQANTNHKLAIANGSTDPTLGAWYTYNPSFNNPYAHQTLGLSVSIPLRIFDRNQGEKQRTQLDIGRNQQLTDATRAQVFSDVDSAYTLVNSNVILLRPYKEKYLAQAVRVRETVTFAYQHGGASLMDFLNAQNDYRTVQLAYLQLIGSYLTAAGQLNFAVGREVIP